MLYWNSQDVKQHVKMQYHSLDGFLPQYISCIRSCFWRPIWKCTFPWCLSNNLMFGNDTHGVGSDSIEACRYTSICCGCWPISYNGWPCICGCQGSLYHTVLFCHCDNDWMMKKQFSLCNLNYINNHLYSVKNFNQLKLRYTDLCNFLNKRALVSPPRMLVVAKDS